MRPWLIILLFLLSACAKPKANDVLATENLEKRVFSSRGTGGWLACYVQFLRKDQPNVYYALEDTAIVMCDNARANYDGYGYFVGIFHPTSDRIRVTIVRPESGTTSIEYIENP